MAELNVRRIPLSAKVALVESEDICLLNIDSDYFISEADSVPEDYKGELVELTDNANGKSRTTQTMEPLKTSSKEQTNPIMKKEQGAQATIWDLYDSYRTEGEECSASEDRQTVPQLVALGRSLTSFEIASLWAEMVDVPWPKDPLHRAEPDEDHRLKLEWQTLWKDDQQFTRVNCIACNPHDRMLFAVAYQNLSTHRGFITCWNVQNISYPELVISTSTNPTIVKFSADHPRLIATGDESGMVHFITIASISGHFAEDQVANNGHKGSVLDLCWVGRKVLSSGSDGRVLMWTTMATSNNSVLVESQVIAELQPSICKLELPQLVELTTLTRPDCLPTPAARCCVAPLKNDKDRFIIGSEDGSLHTFSFMQNYVPLVTKQRHVGSVIHVERIDYQNQEVLISLGSDSMIFIEKLIPGKESHVEPLFQEPMGLIVSFTCNPDRPELMAILKLDSIEMWNIFPAALLITTVRRMPDPILKSSKLTTISFIAHSKALLVGDDIGKIHVYSYNF